MVVPKRRRSPAPRPGTRVPDRRRQVLGLGMILSLIGVGCGTGGQLGAEDLLQQSNSLQSEAAEGALLAQDAVSGDATRIFIREHAADLSTAASEIEVSLKAATTEPALEPKLRQLAVLASQISADLNRLDDASEDEERTLTRELQAAARASQRIGEGLT
jgi:hypothetical protein